MCSGRSYEEVDFSVLVTSDKVSLSNLESVGMTKIIWGIGLTVLHIRNIWSMLLLDSLSATNVVFSWEMLNKELLHVLR